MLGQKTHAQTGCIDQPDSALLCEAGQHVVHICIDQVVVAIGKDAVDRCRLGHAPQELRWISRDADVARLALLLQLPQGRQGLMENLFHIAELDIVHLKQIDVVGLQPSQ